MCTNKFSNNLVCKTNKENEEHVNKFMIYKSAHALLSLMVEASSEGDA